MRTHTLTWGRGGTRRNGEPGCYATNARRPDLPLNIISPAQDPRQIAGPEAAARLKFLNICLFQLTRAEAESSRSSQSRAGLLPPFGPSAARGAAGLDQAQRRPCVRSFCRDNGQGRKGRPFLAVNGGGSSGTLSRGSRGRVTRWCWSPRPGRRGDRQGGDGRLLWPVSGPLPSLISLTAVCPLMIRWRLINRRLRG
jgi:hypothetical protein